MQTAIISLNLATLRAAGGARVNAGWLSAAMLPPARTALKRPR